MLKGSAKILTVRGIGIFIHWTFIFLVGWVVFVTARQGADTREILYNLLLVGFVFVCVTLHELGHALTARRYKVDTKNITLLPIGGVANMEKFPEEPAHEFWIAIAGPIVNFVIAAVLFVLFFALTGQVAIDPGTDPSQFSIGNWKIFLFTLVTVNLILGIFNLVPAFPMDGGRILRAVLSMKMNRVKATNIASNVGKAFAILFGITGLFVNPFLIIIAVFIYLGASYEASYTEMVQFMKGRTVKDVMRTKFVTLNADDNISKAVDELLAGAEQDFIVKENGEVIGVLQRNDMIRALKEGQGGEPIKNFVTTDYKKLKLDDEITEIYMDLLKGDHALMPVYDNGELKGVVEKDNLSEFIMVNSASKS